MTPLTTKALRPRIDGCRPQQQRDRDRRQRERGACDREYLSTFDGALLPLPGPFNFARMMHRAVEQLDTSGVLEVISEEWLEALLEHAQRPEVAAVGARLLLPDGTPQHEGILVGTGGGLAGSVVAERYAFGLSTRSCSAVIDACMLTRENVFHELEW